MQGIKQGKQEVKQRRLMGGGGCWEKPSLSWRKSGRAFLSVNPCGGTMTSCWRRFGQYSVTGLQNVNLMTVGKTLFVPAPWKPLQGRQRQRWAFVSIRWTFESIIPKNYQPFPKSTRSCTQKCRFQHWDCSRHGPNSRSSPVLPLCPCWTVNFDSRGFTIFQRVPVLLRSHRSLSARSSPVSQT